MFVNEDVAGEEMTEEGEHEPRIIDCVVFDEIILNMSFWIQRQRGGESFTRPPHLVRIKQRQYVGALSMFEGSSVVVVVSLDSGGTPVERMVGRHVHIRLGLVTVQELEQGSV